MLEEMTSEKQEKQEKQEIQETDHVINHEPHVLIVTGGSHEMIVERAHVVEIHMITESVNHVMKIGSGNDLVLVPAHRLHHVLLLQMRKELVPWR